MSQTTSLIVLAAWVFTFVIGYLVVRAAVRAGSKDLADHQRRTNELLQTIATNGHDLNKKLGS